MSEFNYQTLRENIVTAIKNKIMTGELKAGTRIKEQKLAEEFGSSRGPIREALRQLEQEGLIEYSRNVGCSVKAVTLEDVYEIYLLRANLEMIAIRQYDCQFTEEDIQSMQDILDQMSALKTDDLDKFLDYDRRFHQTIIKKAGLPRLLKSWEVLDYESLIAGTFSGPNHDGFAKVHLQLLEVLKTRETEKACQAVYDHYMLPLKKMMSKAD